MRVYIRLKLNRALYCFLLHTLLLIEIVTNSARACVDVTAIVVKFETFIIKFKQVQTSSRKYKVRKSLKAALMSVSQSSSSSEDQSIVASTTFAFAYTAIMSVSNVT